jgi:hypothetical protein
MAAAENTRGYEVSNKVYVKVWEVEQFEADFPSYDAKLVDVIAMLQQKLLEIPDEYRDVAECEIDSKAGYEGSTTALITIRYERPETAEEVAERTRRLYAAMKLVEDQERRKLAELAAKYGLPPNGTELQK